MKFFLKITAIITCILGLFFLFLTGTDVGKLCSILVIQCGIIIAALRSIMLNTAKE